MSKWRREPQGHDALFNFWIRCLVQPGLIKQDFFNSQIYLLTFARRAKKSSSPFCSYEYLLHLKWGIIQQFCFIQADTQCTYTKSIGTSYTSSLSESMKIDETIEVSQHFEMQSNHNNWWGYMLCISTSVWVLRIPNAGGNSHFQLKKCKKINKFVAKFSKKLFF